MDAPRARGQLHPDAAAVDAQLGQHRLPDPHQRQLPTRIAADGVHARCQHQVGVVVFGTSQSEGIHAAAI